MARNGFKRYLPVLLMAAVMAESAHAPLIGGALASIGNGGAGKPATAADHPRNDPNKKGAYTWTAPPEADRSDPSAIKKKLKELEREKPYDPWQSYPINPTGLMPDPTVGSPSDLLASVGLPGDGGSEADGFYPSDPIPPTTVVSDGGDAGFYSPANPAVTIDPRHSPVVRGEATPTTPVPEPGNLSAVVCALALLLRPVRPFLVHMPRLRSA